LLPGRGFPLAAPFQYRQAVFKPLISKTESLKQYPGLFNPERCDKASKTVIQGHGDGCWQGSLTIEIHKPSGF